MAIIGARLLSSPAASPREQPYDVRDERLQGFLLRVQASGVRSYYAQVARGKRVLIGKVGVLTPEEARERCGKILGNHAHGRPLLEGIDGAVEGATLGEFFAEVFEPWAKANRPRTAKMTCDRVRVLFGGWFTRPLTSITVADVEAFRQRRLTEDEVTQATVRRDLDTLAAVFTRAMKLKLITEHPVRAVERVRIDRTPKVRFLDAAEERRLREALRTRDVKMIEARESANRWRKERGQEPLPALKHFGDHLTPAVLLSMNTGLRRGELLGLRWANVELAGRNPRLTVEGSTAKGGQTRHIPLNAEAVEVLKHWREQSTGERVFAIDTGFKSAWAPLLTSAKITAFRWHDLRHHFASRLVQVGVPLNTVRELLGHASMAMTLRYAHLAPDQKREAVAKLTELRA
jgi:integrase